MRRKQGEAVRSTFAAVSMTEDSMGALVIRTKCTPDTTIGQRSRGLLTGQCPRGLLVVRLLSLKIAGTVDPEQVGREQEHF